MASILTRPLDGGSSSTNGTSVHSAQPRPSAAGKPSRTASSSILNTTSNRTLPLRNSCNACASTKLKCTKEKPSCSRCVKRAIPCAYVTSKRAGRKPSSRSAISEASPATSPQGTHGQIEDSMARGIDSADSANPDDLEEWLRILEGPITEGQSTDVDMDSLVDVPSAMDMDLDPNNILDFSGMDNMFSMAQLWSVRVDGRGNDNLGNDSTLVSATHDNLAASAPIIQSAPMWSPPVAQMSEPGEILDSTSLPTNSSATPDQSSCTCGNGISDLMNRLTSMATKAQDTMARHNLDHSTVLRLALDVVTLNKEAISNLSVALCCPQDHDGTQILMMAFIVIKIGSSYSLITRECPTQCASGGSGSFGDSARASAHIVFGDLGRLRHIANQLSAKLRVYGATHEWAGSPNWSGQASSPLSSIIYSSLDTDLQRLVKTLSLNVIDRMTTTGS